MPRPLRWRSLGGGILALSALTAATIFVVMHARAGQVRGKSIDLFLAGAEATGVVAGTEVWLAGKNVGTVKEIMFAPVGAPVERRVVLRAQVGENSRQFIRKDARAELRSAGTIIGAPVVYLSGGTLASPSVADGDTVAIMSGASVDDALAQAAELATDAGLIISDLKRSFAVARQMKPVLADAGSGMGRVSHTFSILRERAAAPGGTAGLLLGNREQLAIRSASVMATADTIRTLLRGRAEEIGRFRRDTSVLTALAAVTEDLAELRELVSAPVGTIGRLRSDAALTAAIDSAFMEMSALFADVKRRPLRYIHIF